MKGEDCKVTIREDHRRFRDKQKITTYTRSKKIAIIAAFLLLIAMSLMTLFTFQSINGISELRKEIDHLKSVIKELQDKTKVIRDDSKDVNDFPNVLVDYEEDYVNYDYDQELEYGSYETYDTTDDYDIPNNTKFLKGGEYTKDAKKVTISPRSKRSIIGYTQDGTPINSEGYEGRRRNTTFRKNLHVSTSPPPSSYSYPFYPELRAHQNEEHTTPAPRQIHSRKLHVYQDDNPRDFQQAALLKSRETHNLHENPEVEFTVVADGTLGSGRTRHRQRRLEFDDRHVRTGRMRPLPAAHFSGDTSKYVLGQHDNFNGNGHLRHPQRTFVDWVESSWFHALGMDRHFSLSDGVLTIKEPGLYFIYAQIYYYDEHDINGFRVYKNENETLLQCTTMTHSVDRVMKGNTCFTAAAEYLNENDRVSLGDLSESRYSLFEPGKSFFGVIKLGDVKIK